MVVTEEVRMFLNNRKHHDVVDTANELRVAFELTRTESSLITLEWLNELKG